MIGRVTEELTTHTPIHEWMNELMNAQRNNLFTYLITLHSFVIMQARFNNIWPDLWDIFDQGLAPQNFTERNGNTASPIKVKSENLRPSFAYWSYDEKDLVLVENENNSYYR